MDASTQGVKLAIVADGFEVLDPSLHVLLTAGEHGVDEAGQLMGSGLDRARLVQPGEACSVSGADARRVRAAIEQTFTFRGTHEARERLPEPLETWDAPYATVAKEDQLRWTTLREALEAVRVFLDSVLAGPSDARWDPDAWAWGAGDR